MSPKSGSDSLLRPLNRHLGLELQNDRWFAPQYYTMLG